MKPPGRCAGDRAAVPDKGGEFGRTVAIASDLSGMGKQRGNKIAISPSVRRNLSFRLVSRGGPGSNGEPGANKRVRNTERGQVTTRRPA